MTVISKEPPTASKSPPSCCRSSTFHKHTHTKHFFLLFPPNFAFSLESVLLGVPCWNAFNRLTLSHWISGVGAVLTCSALMPGEERGCNFIYYFFFLPFQLVGGLEEGKSMSLVGVLMWDECLSPTFIPDGAECDCALLMWGICQTKGWDCIQTGKGSNCHFWGWKLLEEYLRR